MEKLIRATPVQKLITMLGESSPVEHVRYGGDAIAMSLLEGLNYNRYCAAVLVKETTGAEGHSIYYVEWQPNRSESLHRYLVLLDHPQYCYGGLYVSRHPLSNMGRAIRYLQVSEPEYVKRIIGLLHNCYRDGLIPPTLNRLAGLNMYYTPEGVDSRFHLKGMEDCTIISHAQGRFYTKTVYGEYKKIPKETSIGDVFYKWRLTGADGYYMLAEGMLVVYPDGQIRLVPHGAYVPPHTDVRHVQGDLIAYVLPNCGFTNTSDKGHIDRHTLEVVSGDGLLAPSMDAMTGLWTTGPCKLRITHPEHGEMFYDASGIEFITPLPGTSRPFEKRGID